MPSDPNEQKNIGGDILSSLVVGASSGAITAFVTFPAFVLKIRAQYGAGLTWRPSVLFRGSVPMAGTVAGIFSLNVLANDSMLRYFYNTKTPNFHQSLICAATAGVVISPIGSLMGFSATIQQKVPVNEKAQNSFVTLYNFLRKHGLARGFIGMPVAAMHTMFISASFLTFAPFFKKKLQPIIKNDFSTSIAAGIVTGVLTSVFVYPLDTIKTKQQANADGVTVRHLALQRFVRDVIRTKGVRGLYAGSFWYFIGLSASITSLAYLKEKLSTTYDHYFLQHKIIQEVNEAERPFVECNGNKLRHHFGFFRGSKTVKKPAAINHAETEASEDRAGRGPAP